MKFVFPCAGYGEKAAGYIGEFYEYSSAVHGAGGLDAYLKESTYSNWLAKVLNDIDLANLPPDRVPGYTYFYVREYDDKIIGMVNIRLALNDFLRTQGGHIGYSIRPLERGKGYGTDMLRGALDFMKRIGLDRVIVTCARDNAASAGLIKKCGGVLDAELYSDYFKKVIHRYIIGGRKLGTNLPPFDKGGKLFLPNN